jgi:hypothetical protein
MAATSGPSAADTVDRSPVTPVRDTKYTNPVEYRATNCKRRGVLVGAARNTVSRLWPCSRFR